MYCSNCGKEFGHDDKFCGNCGNPNPKFTEPVNEVVKSNSSFTDPNTEKILYGVVGFLAPVIGLILSLVTRKDKPEAAKVGLIVSIIRLAINFIYLFFLFILAIIDYI